VEELADSEGKGCDFDGRVAYSTQKHGL
jgi:hypothetical protein